MEFAVTYCTADMIEPILQAKALLEIQVSFLYYFDNDYEDNYN